MTRINGFNPNLPPVNPKLTGKNAQTNEQTQAEAANTSFKSSEDVLSFLANTSYVPLETQQADSTPAKNVVHVSQFVTPEQAQRIAGSVTQFQGLYSTLSNNAMSELNIPKELADKVALETIETKYMPA
jgi:hypothetical protein